MGRIKPKVGAREKPVSGLAQALFSRVRQRVLGIFFGQPDRNFHASEIIRLAESGSGAVQRELKRLAESGILVATSAGNRKQYRANRASPVYKELRGLVLKTSGLSEPIVHALRSYKSKIKAAFIYGSIAKGSDRSTSDIDLMIVGEGLSYSEVYASLHGAERNLHRKINPNILTFAEWKRKSANRNSFISRIKLQPRLFIIGSSDDLEGIG